MIDLEDALAQIVELAPEPPDVSGVARRARERRSRRRGTAIAAIAIVAVVGIGSAVALRSHEPVRPIGTKAPNVESVRVTLLNGAQLEISGPPSLGLTKLEPGLNGELDELSKCIGSSCPVSHSFSVQREAPSDLGAEVGRYPTGDGRELVVYSTALGVDAIVQYEHWVLVVTWNTHRANWPAFAAALNAHESADAYLVISTVGPWYWQLRPTEAPDVQLGGGLYGSGAMFSFFGPSTYPAGCPTEAESEARTAQGWPVSEVNGTWWCDADQHVRIRVGDPALVDDAINSLRVEFLGKPTI